VAGAGEIEQVMQRRSREAILRKIVQQTVEPHGKILKTPAILGEQVQGALSRNLDAVRFQDCQGGGGFRAIHFGLDVGEGRRTLPSSARKQQPSIRLASDMLFRD
jgi:hypothetical protein